MKSSISKALDYFKTCGNAVSELKTDFSKIHSIISSIELIEKFMDDKDEMGKTELRKFDFIGKMRLRNLKKLTDEFLLIKTSFLVRLLSSLPKEFNLKKILIESTRRRWSIFLSNIS